LYNPHANKTRGAVAPRVLFAKSLPYILAYFITAPGTALCDLGQSASKSGNFARKTGRIRHFLHSVDKNGQKGLF
jgi:hypothetical protein